MREREKREGRRKGREEGEERGKRGGGKEKRERRRKKGKRDCFHLPNAFAPGRGVVVVVSGNTRCVGLKHALHDGYELRSTVNVPLLHVDHHWKILMDPVGNLESRRNGVDVQSLERIPHRGISVALVDCDQHGVRAWVFAVNAKHELR